MDQHDIHNPSIGYDLVEEFHSLIQMKTCYIFKISKVQIFLDILETIHPQDAKLMLGMIAKQNIKGVTKALVSEAYPGLILK